MYVVHCWLNVSQYTDLNSALFCNRDLVFFALDKFPQTKPCNGHQKISPGCNLRICRCLKNIEWIANNGRKCFFVSQVWDNVKQAVIKAIKPLSIWSWCENGKMRKEHWWLTRVQGSLATQILLYTMLLAKCLHTFVFVKWLHLVSVIIFLMVEVACNEALVYMARS